MHRFLVVALALVLTALSPARAQDALKVAVGQRGNWDTSVSELGQRAGIPGVVAGDGRLARARDLRHLPRTRHSV